MAIYLDNAATTQVSEKAAAAVMECLTARYGNPSSIHGMGRAAKTILENSRRNIAQLIGARPEEVYFTSGGTEADNWAIRATGEIGGRNGKFHIVSTSFEHPAVLRTLENMGQKGFEATLLDVGHEGLVRPEDLRDAIRADTALVTIMYANNEIGTVQPIQELASLCRSRGVLFHTDAVQAAGYAGIDVEAQNIDMLSISAHKFHGPKGIGAFYCRRGIPLPAFIQGGGQEYGKRAGTENVPAIAGMSAALEEACANMRENNIKLTAMRDMLIEAVSAIPQSRLNGHRVKRLPGIANFSFEGIDGEAAVLMLDLAGICASTASACASGALGMSHVLLALGLSRETARGSVRFSLSKYNTPDEIAAVVNALPPIIARLREMPRPR